MEKWTYDESRTWFWTRTWFWIVPAVIVSGLAYFVFIDEMLGNFGPRVWLAILIGLFAPLVAVFAAWISLQFPWMRGGWKIGFIFNGVACALIAGIIAFFISAFAMSYLDRDPLLHPVPKNVQEGAMLTTQFYIGASAFWGFVYGSWFAMRRDKYFIERL